MIRRNWVLFLLMVPGLLGALALAGRRYDLERQNKSVELALDYAELQNLSVSSGTAIPELLVRFKDAGAVGVAVTEDIMGDLAATGQVNYTERASESGDLTVIHVPNKLLAERVLRALSVRLSRGMVSPDLRNAAAGDRPVPEAFVVRAAPLALNGMGIGLPPDAVRVVQRSGLDVVARLQNHPALTREAVLAAAHDLKQDGVTRLICSMDEVLGFRGLIPHAACAFRAAGLVYGSIEFAKQKGDARMCRELDSELIRVHSIPYAEMAGMSPSTAVERFARAVKERNIRLCYVHLPETSGESPVETNLAFVRKTKTAIEEAGYRCGPARPFGEASQPWILLVLIGLSIAAGGVMLLDSLVTLSADARYGLLAVGFVVLGGFVLSGGTGKQIAALSSALVFPTLAVVGMVGADASYEPHFDRDKSGEKRPWIRASMIFVGMSAFTLLGALLIAGLLGTRPYMVKVEQFMGIKAAHLLPILAVILVMAAGLPMLSEPLPSVWGRVKTNLRAAASHPLFIWHALAVLAALGIIAFALVRTGNDPGMGVTGVELKFRAVLDRFMVVRPRMKEFLIGHPAMLLGIALLLTRRRAWGLPLVALGVLGQVSLLNTFCHIHTPLSVSVLRAVNGLVLGFILGCVAWLVAGRPGASRTGP